MSPKKPIINQTLKLTQEIYKKNVELLEQRRRAEQLLYNLSESIFAVDRNLNITLINKTLEEILHIKLDDVVGKPVDKYVKLKGLNEKLIFAKEYCFNENPDFLDLPNVILETSEKIRYVRIKTSTVSLGADEEISLVTMTDITKEKELEKTKDDFISITSHELRTPMTIIKGYLWMLLNQKGSELTNIQKVYIENASRASQRMINLINDMLAISKIEQGKVEIKIERINIEELLNDFASDIDQEIKKKNLTLEIKAQADLPQVYSDRTKLTEIITNLVGNSLKFTKQGGITIKIEVMKDMDYVKVSIIDTGAGLEQVEIEKLFHKFGRLDNSYQTVAESGGTGLGLYITKLYVEAFSGHVGVKSKGKNTGCTFWFTVPTRLDLIKNTEINVKKQ